MKCRKRRLRTTKPLTNWKPGFVTTATHLLARNNKSQSKFYQYNLKSSTFKVKLCYNGHLYCKRFVITYFSHKCTLYNNLSYQVSRGLKVVEFRCFVGNSKGNIIQGCNFKVYRNCDINKWDIFCTFPFCWHCVYKSIHYIVWLNHSSFGLVLNYSKLAFWNLPKILRDDVSQCV